jgi:hypothetical protein
MIAVWDVGIPDERRPVWHRGRLLRRSACRPHVDGG